MPARQAIFRVWGHVSDILNISEGYAGTYEGRYCRGCGIALYRKIQNDTMLRGWWNLLFFVNFGYIIANYLQLRQLRQLSDPAPTPKSETTPKSAPLEPGSPLTQRAGTWVSAGITALLILLIVTGRITLFEPQPTESPCGRYYDERLERLWCDDPNINVEVIQILGPYATTDAACAPETLFSTKPKDGQGFECWGYGDGSRWRDEP